jgi:hypothetical protein
MKFPGGGGIFLRGIVWLRNQVVRAGNRIPKTEGGLEVKKAAPSAN